MDVTKKTQIEASKNGFKVLIQSDGTETKVRLIKTLPGRRQDGLRTPPQLDLSLDEFLALPELLVEFQGLLV